MRFKNSPPSGPKDAGNCADKKCMILFLELLGFLALFSLLALVKMGRSARDGFEDGAGFHYCEEASDSRSSARNEPSMQAFSPSEQTTHQQAA